MSAKNASPVVYFGKIPSRGDFVRSSHQANLIQSMDRWLTQAIELMASDARWKEVYDRAQPTRFAFLGMKSRVALVGHLVASTDASGRRFPFLTATSFEVDTPPAFMARSPLLLERTWARLERLTLRACAAENALALSELDQAQVDADTELAAPDKSYHEFLDLHTLGGLQGMLQPAKQGLNLRHTFLALGLLLQPVPASGASQLDRGLQLPLPVDPLFQPLVATLWMDLISRFLHRGDFEIALFTPSAGQAGAPRLALGFSGGSPAGLQAVLDPQVGEQVFLDLSDSPWVEAQVQDDYAMKKLSSYMQQPQLSLRQAVATFRETFLGD